jgi:type I restriction enzyme S subunit
MTTPRTKLEEIAPINLKHTTVSSSWILEEGEKRLDAEHFTQEGFMFKKILEDSGYDLWLLGKLRIFNPPPLKRHFIGKTDASVPYLMPSELFDYRVAPEKYVAPKKIKNVEDWYVKEGWIILSQSGNAGRPLFVTKEFENIVISQNAIRIVPDENTKSGFLYAYLSTKIGQSLLSREEFGVTVKHLRPHHVANVPVPAIDPQIIERIDQQIIKAAHLREEANKIENATIAELEMLLTSIKKPESTSVK